jgi:hypothetical protein
MKTSTSPRAGALLWQLLPIFALILAACGSEPTAAAPPQPTETPVATTAPTQVTEAPPAAEPSATATATAAAKPAPPQTSGRPAVLKSDSSEITDTFGSTPASKLVLGDKEIATLRLPEGGLHTATVLTFKIDGRARSSGGQIGKIYQISAVVPPSSTPEQIESNGPPFVLELPAGAKKDVNLAIGVEDDKGKVKWTVVAPKHVDDSRNVAVFELTTLPSGWVHLTTKPAGK